MKKSTLLILLAIATSYGKLSAQESNSVISEKAGWQKIADKSVDVKRNRDEITVASSDVRYTSMKVIVKDAEINLYGLEVYYDGGNGQIINVGQSFQPNTESLIYPLRDGQKDLRKIAIAYKSLPGKKAHIEVWGFKTVMYGDLK